MTWGSARHVPATIALIGATLTATACVGRVEVPIYTVREERRFAVTGRPDVTLSTFDGSIELRAWDRPEVVVEIEKRAGDRAMADAIQVNAEQAGDRILVDVPAPSRSESRIAFRVRSGSALFGTTGVSARLIASLPRDCNLIARTRDGSIRAERLSGRVELWTGSGRIRAAELSGRLRIHSEDGSLAVLDADGEADLDSGDGSIELTGRLSAVRARTSDGTVTLRVMPGSAAAAPWEVRTGDGSVTIELPDTFGAELDASTGDGRVRLAGISLASMALKTQRSLRGTIGPGGPTLLIRTGDGTITIRRF